MKNTIKAIALVAISVMTLGLSAQDAKREKTIPQEWKREKTIPQEWKREKTIPQEWKNGSTPSTTDKKEQYEPVYVESTPSKKLKQSRSLVTEANSDIYKNAASYRKGTLIGSKSYVSSTEISKQKIVILFNTNTTWASPLLNNELKVSNDKINQILLKYKLQLEKYYGVDTQQDGLVIKFTTQVKAEEAAAELSKVDGVNFVYLKVRK